MMIINLAPLDILIIRFRFGRCFLCGNLRMENCSNFCRFGLLNFQHQKFHHPGDVREEKACHPCKHAIHACNCIAIPWANADIAISRAKACIVIPFTNDDNAIPNAQDCNGISGTKDYIMKRNACFNDFLFGNISEANVIEIIRFSIYFSITSTKLCKKRWNPGCCAMFKPSRI